MSQPEPPKRPTTAQPNPGEAKSSVGSLVSQIVADQKEQKQTLKAAMERSDKRSNLGPIALGLLIVLNVAAWAVFPPKGETGGDSRSPAEIERDLRIIIASAATDVDVWRRLNENRMPRSLAEAKVRDSTLRFSLIDSVVYEIRSEHRGVTLAYRSNMAVTDFLEGGVPVRR